MRCSRRCWQGCDIGDGVGHIGEGVIGYGVGNVGGGVVDGAVGDRVVAVVRDVVYVVGVGVGDIGDVVGVGVGAVGDGLDEAA